MTNNTKKYLLLISLLLTGCTFEIIEHPQAKDDPWSPDCGNCYIPMEQICPLKLGEEENHWLSCDYEEFSCWIEEDGYRCQLTETLTPLSNYDK